MRVLLKNISSLGAVVHALPAVAVACENNPELAFDMLNYAYQNITAPLACLKYAYQG
jgi:hypothetical protein